MVTAAISYRNNIFKKNVRRSFPPHQEDIPGRFAQHMAFMSNYNDDDDDDELLDGMVDRQNAFSLISSRDLISLICTPQAEFELAQDLRSGFAKSS